MKRSTPTTYGLAICALLGVIDIISLGGLGANDGPLEHPGFDGDRVCRFSLLI